MTKKDIVVRIADETGVKQTDVKNVVQKYLDYVIDSLAKGETVELRNFGVFKVKTRKGRMGRNPR
ncbi:MAG: HU family DNA-binding protein, partial [Candidatus Omnitrophota bacterium]|nr:HU family DNA-binding protein [Candidatus Omnitrophota bacterium]